MLTHTNYSIIITAIDGSLKNNPTLELKPDHPLPNFTGETASCVQYGAFEGTKAPLHN